MESNFAPSKIIEKIKELNKNCVIILGGEPVVSNHIKKEIRTFTDLHNIEYQLINLETSNKLNEVKLLFENESLFSNHFLYSLSITGGRVLEEVKKFLVKVISENTNNLFIIHFQKPTKELLKSAWFQEIKKKINSIRSE